MSTNTVTTHSNSPVEESDSDTDSLLTLDFLPGFNVDTRAVDWKLGFSSLSVKIVGDNIPSNTTIKVSMKASVQPDIRAEHIVALQEPLLRKLSELDPDRTKEISLLFGPCMMGRHGFNEFYERILRGPLTTLNDLTFIQVCEDSRGLILDEALKPPRNATQPKLKHLKIVGPHATSVNPSVSLQHVYFMCILEDLQSLELHNYDTNHDSIPAVVRTTDRLINVLNKAPIEKLTLRGICLDKNMDLSHPFPIPPPLDILASISLHSTVAFRQAARQLDFLAALFATDVNFRIRRFTLLVVKVWEYQTAAPDPPEIKRLHDKLFGLSKSIEINIQSRLKLDTSRPFTLRYTPPAWAKNPFHSLTQRLKILAGNEGNRGRIILEPVPTPW